MIKLSKLPEHVGKVLDRPFTTWLNENYLRTNNKIDLVTSPTDGNVPILNGDGELTDDGKAAPGGEFVGDTDTQTLSNKTLITPTIADFTNATHDHEDAAGGGQIDEDALALTDVTTNNSSTTKHGFLKKLSNVVTEFLNGQGNFSTPDHGSLGGLTDDDHTQYLNTTRHDTPTRHGDAVLFTATWADYSGTSTITGWDATGLVKKIYYKKIGNTVLVSYYINGTSNATTVSFTVPYNASTSLAYYEHVCHVKDNDIWSTGPGFGYIDSAGTANLVIIRIDGGFTNVFTAANNKQVRGQFWYEAA